MLELQNLGIIDAGWLKSCILNQKEAALRLEMSERYLRELDVYCPPRLRCGNGYESEYKWPALFFWWLEFQVARAYEGRDGWVFGVWLDKVCSIRQLQIGQERLNNLVTALRKAGVSRTLIESARRVLSPLSSGTNELDFPKR